VEQAILTSWSPRGSLFTFVFASTTTTTTWKLQLVSLHRLHRLYGRVVGFLIQFFQAEHIIQSRNADPPLRK
jgi:hypothetical protein